MKFKNILRILSGSKSFETIIFSGCYFTSDFFYDIQLLVLLYSFFDIL